MSTFVIPVHYAHAGTQPRSVGVFHTAFNQVCNNRLYYITISYICLKTYQFNNILFHVLPILRLKLFLSIEYGSTHFMCGYKRFEMAHSLLNDAFKT